MRRLGGRVDNRGWPKRRNEIADPLAIPDVQFVVGEVAEILHQASLIPSGVALVPEEHRLLIVVQAVDGESKLGEICRNL